MMHVDAPHPNCAYLWMEHSLNIEAAGRPVGLVRLGAGGAGCLHRATGMLTTKDASANGIEEFERIWFWRTPVANCPQGGACVPYYRWVTDYIAVIGGR